MTAEATIACTLCDPDLGPIIAGGAHWRVVLNRNQDLLGKCFLATRRHIEDVRDLTPDEWLEAHALLTTMTGVLAEAFRPDHVNYAFLMNQDRHVHLHIVPRYAGPHHFGGATFTDPGYPGHYLIDLPPCRLRPDDEATLATLLRRLAGARS
jgi:diadenosine tetraphosphate (Ap4A) HIT family hydrolase